MNGANGSEAEKSRRYTWVAVLGRRDTPTDGVEDYCSFLGRALQQSDIVLRQTRVQWAEQGWIAALRTLWAESANWRDSWVLLQYTTMMWSRRGFPFGAYAVLSILHRRGLRCAVVFHEPVRQDGDRWFDGLRGRLQDWVIRRLYSGASKAIFLDPLDKIRWLPSNATKAAFIPIGANIPEGQADEIPSPQRNGGGKTVAVFCVSDPPYRQREIGDIAHAMRLLAQQGVKARVVFVGRGTAEAHEEINSLFDSGAATEVVNLGLQSAEEVRRILSAADAMLCVRGPLYMRRGSAIAGIACGLPIVGYAGAAEGTPLEEAGLELVPYGDRDALGRALDRVLIDPERRQTLQGRSRHAQRECFSWRRIADSFVRCLGLEMGSP